MGNRYPVIAAMALIVTLAHSPSASAMYGITCATAYANYTVLHPGNITPADHPDDNSDNNLGDLSTPNAAHTFRWTASLLSKLTLLHYQNAAAHAAAKPSPNAPAKPLFDPIAAIQKLPEFQLLAMAQLMGATAFTTDRCKALAAAVWADFESDDTYFCDADARNIPGGFRTLRQVLEHDFLDWAVLTPPAP